MLALAGGAGAGLDALLAICRGLPAALMPGGFVALEARRYGPKTVLGCRPHRGTLRLACCNFCC